MAPEFITPNHMSSTINSGKPTMLKNPLRAFVSSNVANSSDSNIMRNNEVTSATMLGKTLSKLLANIRSPNNINTLGGGLSASGSDIKRIRLIATPIVKSTDPTRMDLSQEGIEFKKCCRLGVATNTN